MYFPLTTFEGYCASCETERPLLVIEHGARGFRAWLAGSGHEDRTLSHTCRVCGRNEHVPLTEAEDEAYDLTLRRWPDTFLLDAPTLELQWEAPAALAQAAQVVPAAPAASAVDVFTIAAQRLATAAPRVLVIPMQRRPLVHVLTLPAAPVQATDGRLLALAA